MPGTIGTVNRKDSRTPSLNRWNRRNTPSNTSPRTVHSSYKDGRVCWITTTDPFLPVFAPKLAANGKNNTATTTAVAVAEEAKGGGAAAPVGPTTTTPPPANSTRGTNRRDTARRSWLGQPRCEGVYCAVRAFGGSAAPCSATFGSLMESWFCYPVGLHSISVP